MKDELPKDLRSIAFIDELNNMPALDLTDYINEQVRLYRRDGIHVEIGPKPHKFPETKTESSIVGKTVSRIIYPNKYKYVTIVFTDGTTFKVSEKGQVGQLEVQINDKIIEQEEND